MNMFKVVWILVLLLVISSCGGGGGDTTQNNSQAASTTTSTTNTTSTATSAVTILADAVACAPSVGSIVISGTVSYERVPFSTTAGAGLDFNNIQTLPIRGAEIQALGAGNCVMATSTTSNTGTYSFNIDPNIPVKIRVKARTESTTGATWNFEVRDNTNSNGLYVLDGALVDPGSGNTTRHLTATTGWTGSSYGGTRTAAPFAILDSIYSALLTVVATDASAAMSAADIFWSVNNSTANGNLTNGEIGGSFYSNNQIYILGTQNSDTDEFDTHVVIHEWGHYFEDNFSRSDSLGGSHAVTSKLDLRVALSEGFANAFSGIVTGDPVYRDSFGNQQATDFRVDVESNATSNIGWFNEGSVQTIIYDIFDSTSDANDTLSLGFTPIYNAMTNAAYTGQASRTSIFSWLNTFNALNPGSVAAINTLTTSQSISNVADNFGTGETNNGGDANDLPVYKIIADNNVPVMVCSSNTNGEFNRLGNRQLMRLTTTSTSNKTVTVTRVSGLATSDPDLRVYLNNNLISVSESSTNNTETLTRSFTNATDYILEVYEFTNIDSNATTGGNVCFNVTVI